MADDDTKGKREYEDRLRRRLKILGEQLEAGKVRFPRDNIELIKKSFMAVRYGPDGEIDLSTVDGVVRSTALAVAEMHDRQEAKQMASLEQIQRGYFRFLEENFGPYYQKMIEKGVTPHQFATAVSRDPSAVRGINKDLNKVLDFISEFWGSAAYISTVHIQDDNSKSLRFSFGGDLFPSNEENIASKCGIYADQIILPDPFIRCTFLFKTWQPKQRVYYLIKHALNILQYKPLACPEGIPPIVVILPDSQFTDEHERDYILSLGKEDAVLHLNKAFGRECKSFDEWAAIANDWDDIKKIEDCVKQPSRILFDADDKRDVRSQINGLVSSCSRLFKTSHPGNILAANCASRLSICSEMLIRSRRYNATPLIDAPTSWQYFSWKMEYDAERFGSGRLDVNQLHISRALQRLGGGEMPWLGRVPADALVEIRKEGALGEIREILSGGIHEIVMKNPDNFYRSADQVMDNINDAFDQHMKALDALSSKKWKFAGVEVGKWIVVGSIGIAAAATGNALLGIATFAADQLLETKKIKDFPKALKELSDESAKLRKSPVGIMFKCSR